MHRSQLPGPPGLIPPCADLGVLARAATSPWFVLFLERARVLECPRRLVAKAPDARAADVAVREPGNQVAR
jgi:hypothetical protein